MLRSMSNLTFCPIISYTLVMKLDYTLETIEERKAFVEKILEEDPHPSPKYLEILTDYLVLCLSKEEKKKKEIMTENRMATVSKRETSYEGLVSQFENGEDGVYNLLNNDKHIIFRPKVSITEQDLEEIPELRAQKEVIAFWEKVAETAEGKEKYIAKKALIDARKDQYVIKSQKKQMVTINNRAQMPKYIYQNRYEGYITFDEQGYCVPHGYSLINPEICSTIMCNYHEMRECADYNCDSPFYYLMEEFDDTVARALKDHPVYQLIMEDKIAEMQNIEIQKGLIDTFGIRHSLEYISSLWRKKIPAVIASQAEDDFLEWHFTYEEKGAWKRCSKCGKVKLAHNKYFSKNSTSKDGYYSICKECRNAKTKKKNEEEISTE